MITRFGWAIFLEGNPIRHGEGIAIPEGGAVAIADSYGRPLETAYAKIVAAAALGDGAGGEGTTTVSGLGRDCVVVAVSDRLYKLIRESGYEFYHQDQETVDVFLNGDLVAQVEVYY